MMKPSIATAFAVCSILAGVAVGCGGETPPPQAPPPAPRTTASTPPTTSPTVSQVKRPVNVSDEIRGICGLPEPKEAPKFDFDTADVTGEDRTILQGIAKCMMTGPLQGKSIRLVGRADSRGEPEYNMALGAKRSSNVKQFLGSLGVPDSRLMQTSRGELDAKGTDEDSYRLDRRVDIELQK